MNSVLITCERCGRDAHAPDARLVRVEWRVIDGRGTLPTRKSLLTCTSCARAIDDGAYPFKVGAPELGGAR